MKLSEFINIIGQLHVNHENSGSYFINFVGQVKFNHVGSGAYNDVFVSDTAYTIEGHTSRWVIKCPLQKIANNEL